MEDGFACGAGQPPDVIAAARDRRKTRRSTEDRRQFAGRGADTWSDAARAEFIRRIRDERRDERAITIRRGREVADAPPDLEE